MHIRQVGGLGLSLGFLIATLAACGAPSGPSIKVEDVWARPAIAVQSMVGEGSGQPSTGEVAMGLAGTGGVFMRLVNQGSEADRLVGGQTEVAKAVEIHETVREGDVMRMQMLANGLELPPKGEVLLKPGSYHVMLIGLQQDLNVGDRFSLDLEFEKSGTITVEPEVREP